MSLLEYAANDQLEVLEEAWIEVVESPGEVADPVAALERLVADGWSDRAAPLGLTLAEPLLAAERFEDALDVLRPVAGYVGEEEALRRQLLAAIRGAHAADLWREIYLEVSGLPGEIPVARSLATYEHMREHEPGRAVLNAAGWGLGVIEERGPTGRLMVRFPDGALRPFDPHQLAERLKLLDRDDFRALKLTDIEGLKQTVKKDPATIVRSVAASRGGSISSADLRAELLNGILTKSQWTTFWKAARAAVTMDPLIALNGPPTRPRILLRERPVTLGEEALINLARAAGKRAAARVVSSYIEKGVEGEEREALLERLAGRITPDAAARGPEAAAGALAILIVLDRYGRPDEASPADVLREACETVERPATMLPKLLAVTDDSALRNDIVRLTPGAWSDEIVDRLASVYVALPRDTQDTTCEVLLEHDGAPVLAALMTEMIRLPSRHAEPLLGLTKVWSAGRLNGVDGSPCGLDVLHAFIPILAGLGRGTGEALKLYKAWHQIVTGKRNPLLDRLIRDLSEEEARQTLANVDMHRDLPDEIAHWIRGGIRERFPDLIHDRDIPFWQHDVIFCTHDGIDRRKEELRILLDVKLPENAEAIGRAASFGDLSENAEWQAAIEDRGLLSQRAQELQAEVDRARPLENAPIPEGVVAPGCRVRLRDREGAVRELILLGPWDGTDDERIVSYRSPLAEGLLGTKVGENATTKLPDGDVIWTVLSVEPAV